MSIKAMKQALETLEWIARVNAMDYEYQAKAREHISTLRAAIEQAEKQEPVAWMTRFDDPERGSYGKPADTHLKRDEADRQVQRHVDKRLCKLRVEPIYTAPQPQREWVGLTDEDRLAIENECENMIGKPAFDAIEKKLKELNT